MSRFDLDNRYILEDKKKGAKMSFFRFRRPTRNFSMLGVITALALFVASDIAHAADPDVIILGAGLAGLSTAYRLNKEGKSILILDLTSHIDGQASHCTSRKWFFTPPVATP